MKCEYCEIPKGELITTDYFNQMILWRQYVNDGNLKEEIPLSKILRKKYLKRRNMSTTIILNANAEIISKVELV